MADQQLRLVLSLVITVGFRLHTVFFTGWLFTIQNRYLLILNKTCNRQNYYCVFHISCPEHARGMYGGLNHLSLLLK